MPCRRLHVWRIVFRRAMRAASYFLMLLRLQQLFPLSLDHPHTENTVQHCESQGCHHRTAYIPQYVLSRHRLRMYTVFQAGFPSAFPAYPDKQLPAVGACLLHQVQHNLQRTLYTSIYQQHMYASMSYPAMPFFVIPLPLCFAYIQDSKADQVLFHQKP